MKTRHKRQGYPAWQRLGLLGGLLVALLFITLVSILLRPAPDFADFEATSRGLLANLAARDGKQFEFTPEDFPFDPNTVSRDELLRLGVSERRATSWLKYRGNRPRAFRRPTDIGKLYGLSDELKERLIGLAFVPEQSGDRAPRPTESFPFHVNTVERGDLMRLGLKAYQAKAFISYRSKIEAGFTKPSQLERLRFLEEEQRERLLANAIFPEPPPVRLAQRFTFDPNLVSADSLKLLGFPGYQALSLVRYRGGRRVTFRKPEDLRRVRSLDSAMLELVIPLVRIDLPTDYAPASAPKNFKPKPLPELASIDLNTADTTLLKTIPGIGSYRARRFVRYREALGGFYDLAQASATRGIPDSTWRAALPYLRLGPVYRKIPVNRASVEALKKHPSINSKLANAVVRFREKHGPFLSAEDLRQVRLFNDGNLPAILPYLSFE